MKRALCLMLLTVFVCLAGCGTAPVRKEPEIPAKRPVSEYVKPDATYAIDAYDPWEPMNRRIYNFNAIFDNVIFLPVVQGLRVRAAGFRPDGDHAISSTTSPKSPT